jgi:SNF2 family DNA or RNA helicase
MLTGSPIQNNLRELWCIFDFVFPERLGAFCAGRASLPAGDDR